MEDNTFKTAHNRKRHNATTHPVTGNASDPPTSDSLGVGYNDVNSEDDKENHANTLAHREPLLPRPLLLSEGEQLQQQQQLLDQQQELSQQQQLQQQQHIQLRQEFINQIQLLQQQQIQLQQEFINQLQAQYTSQLANNNALISSQYNQLLRLSPSLQFCAGISFQTLNDTSFWTSKDQKLAGFPCLVGEALRGKGNHVQYHRLRVI